MPFPPCSADRQACLICQKNPLNSLGEKGKRLACIVGSPVGSATAYKISVQTVVPGNLLKRVSGLYTLVKNDNQTGGGGGRGVEGEGQGEGGRGGLFWVLDCIDWRFTTRQSNVKPVLFTRSTCLTPRSIEGPDRTEIPERGQMGGVCRVCRVCGVCVCVCVCVCVELGCVWGGGGGEGAGEL